MNILIIDDDVFAKKMLGHHLLDMGHTVTTVSNGQEALLHIERNNNMEVILLDLFMPQLSGPSFLLLLSKQTRKPLPKIVIVSGARDGENLLKDLGIAYDYYFHKPIDFTLLNIAIEKKKKTA